jgi:hypothetical protein
MAQEPELDLLELDHQYVALGDVASLVASSVLAGGYGASGTLAEL